MLRLLGILALVKMFSGGNCRRRSSGFPGGLFLLPVLLCGGWMAIAVVGGVLGLIGTVIGGVFEGLGALAENAFSGNGLLLGIVIGLALFFWVRKRTAAQADEE